MPLRFADTHPQPSGENTGPEGKANVDQIRTQGASGVDGNRWGAQEPKRPLTQRQEQILAIIKQAIAETGVSPSRSEIAAAAKCGGQASSIEGHLLALARRGAIELAPGHRSIRVVDEDETPIIEGDRNIGADERLASEQRTVDRLQGTLTRRVIPKADYFLRVQDEGPGTLGIEPGDLVAVRETIDIRTGSLVMARNEHGTLVWMLTQLTSNHGVELTPTGNRQAQDQSATRAGGKARMLRIEGVITGIVQVRRIYRGRNTTTGKPNNADGRKATGTPEREPSPQQAAVLKVLLRLVRRKGIAPALQEMSEELGGLTTGAIHKHLEELTKKHLVDKRPSGQRRYWPSDLGIVPMVDPDRNRSKTSERTTKRTTIDRVPSVLGEQFEPRPDFFIPATEQIGDMLELQTTDLIAVQANSDAKEGEIVIADDGTGQLVCGELRRRDDGEAEQRSVICTSKTTLAKEDSGNEIVQIEGVAIGTVTFRSL